MLLSGERLDVFFAQNWGSEIQAPPSLLRISSLSHEWGELLTLPLPHTILLIWGVLFLAFGSTLAPASRGGLLHVFFMFSFRWGVKK
jgi:hypothetical protein